MSMLWIFVDRNSETGFLWMKHVSIRRHVLKVCTFYPYSYGYTYSGSKVSYVSYVSFRASVLTV
jgi:hypothetical protein